MNQTTEAIDLQKFCSPYEGGLMQRLATPFSRGNFTYATDDKIMVRVPRRFDVPEREDAPHAENIWPANEPEFVRVNRVSPLPKPGIRTCTRCGGRRTEHDCPDCECECGMCEGAGTEDEFPAVTFRGSAMQLCYAILLLSLPKLELDAAPGGGSMMFRFAGGEGLLALLRPHHELPILCDLEEPT